MSFVRDWQRMPLFLTVAAALISIVAATPLIYIFVRALAADGELWRGLWYGQMPLLLRNTIVLVLLTVVCVLAIGISAAWLTERSNVPGRALWRLLLALPLAIPAYVMAICYIILLRRGGVLEWVMMGVAGIARGELPLPNLYNLGGAVLIIVLSVFPYIYLPAAAALRSFDRSMEEAARMAGRSAWQTFRKITLPIISPSLAGGTLMVALYVLSDFGTVAMLRFRTFTTAIYNQLSSDVDRSGAAILSAVLVTIAVPLFLAEHWISRRDLRLTGDGAWRPRQVVQLGRWRWLGFIYLLLLVLASVGIPLLVLGGLSLQGWLYPSDADRIWGINNDGLSIFGWNSLMVSVLAATGATFLSFAPAYLAVRFPNPLTQFLLNLSKSPFALPGVIIGLAFIMLLNRWLPFLYGTVAALLFAFVFRLLPQSLATGESALRSVSPTLEQAARTLGSNAPTVFWRVSLPVAAPGLAASWALVFISAMKELPTAILLRPPGFDTLPVRIWAAASESVHTQAAPPAFLLIVLTTITLLVLMRTRVGLERVLAEGG